jgi:hypothetical protein
MSAAGPQVYNEDARAKNVNLLENVRLRLYQSVRPCLKHTCRSQTPHHPDTSHHSTALVLSRANPPINTDYGRPTALQRRLLPLALPAVGTRSHHILADFSWLHLWAHLEIMESACQVRHSVHHRNFL